MPNEFRLKTVCEKINTIPYGCTLEPPEGDSWDQRDYIKKHKCGTSACVAGWAILMFGTPEEQKRVDRHIKLKERAKTYRNERRHMDGIETIARSILDINKEQADLLFASDNKLHYINVLIRDLVNGHQNKS